MFEVPEGIAREGRTKLGPMGRRNAGHANGAARDRDEARRYCQIVVRRGSSETQAELDALTAVACCGRGQIAARPTVRKVAI
jgi:hypothetical protein